MMVWRVYFDADTAVVIIASDDFSARLQAQFQAWSVTGKWLPVVRVEQVQGCEVAAVFG